MNRKRRALLMLSCLHSSVSLVLITVTLSMLELDCVKPGMQLEASVNPCLVALLVWFAWKALNVSPRPSSGCGLSGCPGCVCVSGLRI